MDQTVEILIRLCFLVVVDKESKSLNAILSALGCDSVNHWQSYEMLVMSNLVTTWLVILNYEECDIYIPTVGFF